MPYVLGAYRVLPAWHLLLNYSGNCYRLDDGRFAKKMKNKRRMRIRRR